MSGFASTHSSGRYLAAGLVALGLLGASAQSSAAESCLDQVRKLAERHRLSDDPPTVSPNGGPKPTPEQLGRSGGVIEPPPVQDKSVIAPPPGTGSRMPTVPDVAQPSTPAPKPETPNAIAAADRTTLQALLVAARAQAERGMERECLDRLDEARRIAQRSN